MDMHTGWCSIWWRKYGREIIKSDMFKLMACKESNLCPETQTCSSDLCFLWFAMVLGFGRHSLAVMPAAANVHEAICSPPRHSKNVSFYLH